MERSRINYSSLNPDFGELQSILSNIALFLQWGDIQQVARFAVDAIIFSYKYDYIPGLQEYEVRVSQLDILGLITLNSEEFKTKVRCHQWTPGTIKMNYGENA